MAAPRSSLQVGAQLHEPLGSHLELSHRTIPLLSACFEFMPNSPCDVIGLAKMTARLRWALSHFRRVFINHGFQLANFSGCTFLKAFDQRPSLLSLFGEFLLEQLA
jgi:hypothetical protein